MPMSPVRLHGKMFAVVEGNASKVVRCMPQASAGLWGAGGSAWKTGLGVIGSEAAQAR